MVTKGADTELGWSTELEEANRSLDEAIGYLDLDYPDAAEKVRQSRRSRPKGVEEKGKGKGESNRDRARTPAREPATSSGGTKGAKQRKRCREGQEPSLDPCDPDHPEARRDLMDLGEDALRTNMEASEPSRAGFRPGREVRSESLTELTAETVGTSAKRR